MEVNFLHRNPRLEEMEIKALSSETKEEVNELLQFMLFWERKQDEEILAHVVESPNLNKRSSQKEEADYWLNKILEGE